MKKARGRRFKSCQGHFNQFQMRKYTKKELKDCVISFLKHSLSNSGLKRLELIAFYENKEKAREVLEKKLYNGGLSHRILANGLGLYRELYGTDNWIDFYREQALKKMVLVKLSKNYSKSK